MRISQHFQLGVRQAELDFVDIDTDGDTALFLDPFVLASRTDSWCEAAHTTLHSFFTFFINLVYAGQLDEARELFNYLHEPNETCLGLSRGRPRGNGVGDQDADRIFESLIHSRAATTGLLTDLEDCKVFVRGVDKDKTSDMTTNIMRKHLVDYTVEQCRLWDMPLRAGGQTGFYWNPVRREWQSDECENMIVDRRRILLVPKAVVSYCKKYTGQQYHQHFVLNFLQHEELRLRGPLVRRRYRRGVVVKEYVTKRSLVQEGGAAFDKDFLANFTLAHPEVFHDFRRSQRTKEPTVPLEEYSDNNIPAVCDYLEQKLIEIPPGPEAATRFHRTVVSILDFLFYPYLYAPAIEQEIHEGRKRIDVRFSNGASSGFFQRLPNQAQLPCPFIFVECKNYARDIANPELDQLAGRFSIQRGKVGLLVCRSLNDPELFKRRCRDTHVDHRGLIFPLVDEDLIAGLRARSLGIEATLEDLLERLYAYLAM
jgi:hypothetical protein